MNLLVFLSVAGVTLATVTLATVTLVTVTSVPGCRFGVDDYPIGSQLPSSNCFRLRCQENLTWEIDDIAAGCKVSKFENGGGVRSYDNFCTPYFKDMGTSHYTLSTYWKPVGTYSALDVETIFAEYDPCVMPAVPGITCIKKTRYETDSIEIIVTNNNNSQILVNGANFILNSNLKTVVADGAYQEVVAQKIFGDCVHVIGKLNSLIACPNAVFVFAGTSLDFTLNGLSGYYDGSVSSAPEDDQTGKCASVLASTFWTHPDTFPLSWRLQSNPGCNSTLPPLPDGSTNTGCNILTTNILDCNDALDAVPAAYVYLPALKKTCQETLCEASASASASAVDFWFMQVQKSAELEVQLMITFPILMTPGC